MKLNELEILKNLTHPTNLLNEDEFLTYVELKDKAPAQAQSILDNALCDYYRYVRPSARRCNTTNEQILSYGINAFVVSLITEEAFKRYYHYHNYDYDTLSECYDTIEEQKLGLPDFKVFNNFIEIKATSKKDINTWFNDIVHFNRLNTLHNADRVYVLTECSYSRNTNKLTFIGLVSRLEKVDDTHYKVDETCGMTGEISYFISQICELYDIKCKIINYAF